MDATSLEGGLTNAPVTSSFAFRAALDAMSRPGRIGTLMGAKPPAPISVAAGTLLLTLCDPETPVHLAGPADQQMVRDWLTFHTGSPIVAPADAMFAIGPWDDLKPLGRFRIGTSEYPDRSTTLIVECDALESSGAHLTGPGIRDLQTFGLPEITAFQQNRALFPLGLDFFFTAGDQVAALPRTTIVEAF